ncbi:hypothetical protein [Chryseobacterium sp.]|uniref:hypothetical protein n=1 Tax=Chryseobacterium sp. TaxID=1871047 RepID=UPI0028995A95|nr:hypothetical protein [Chryseobacterium sp.]
MKASAVSTITKSLPIALPVLVNYSLLATLGYINLFCKENELRQMLRSGLKRRITGDFKP